MKTAGSYLEDKTFETQQDVKNRIVIEFGGYDGLETGEAAKVAADLEGAEVLLFYYHCYSYDGDAIVVYVKNGQFYEVNGNHCSCMGLEGQWKPEATSYEALAARFPASNAQYCYEHLKVQAVRSILPGNLAHVN